MIAAEYGEDSVSRKDAKLAKKKRQITSTKSF
jgi:hypothetical protein